MVLWFVQNSDPTVHVFESNADSEYDARVELDRYVDDEGIASYQVIRVALAIFHPVGGATVQSR